jgi:methyltransferase (TIGR00027 family)
MLAIDSLGLDPVPRGAVGAARQRALHLLMDGEPKVFVDEWAIKLTGDDPEALRERASTFPFPRSAWVLRSRYTEDLLADALDAGCRQYVILGAGLDSFVQRHADALAGLRVYEVDDPPLQNWKRERLTQLGVFAPPQCVYVPCDFASQSLSEALRQAGFAADQPAFVSWLAVTQYLSQAAITETLAWFANLAARSQLVLTYVLPEGSEGSMTPFQWAWVHERRASGLPFDTFFTPASMERLLRDAGLIDVEHLSPE